MSYDLLKGMRVVESSAFIAAPLCGLTLAQYGVDVIRIDMIGGGIDYGRMPLMPSQRSLYWTGLNKNKRSVAVDIRHPEGRELVRALACAPGPDGGILLTNVPSKWLSHRELVGWRADMITCTIEGNADGSTAVDYTVNSATGYPMITGEGSTMQPVNHTLPAWDIACALQASSAILAAVERRRRDGTGAELKMALSDVAFALMSHLGLLAEVELLGQDRKAIGNDIYGAFGRDFATADGERVMVAAISLKQWRALVKACGMAETISVLEKALEADFNREADRFEHRDSIAALVKRWCGARSFAQVSQTFDQAGVCWGPYQTIGQLLAQDARVSSENPIFSRIETQGIGSHLAAGTAVRIADIPRAVPAPAPLLGADTDAVLAGVLDLSRSEIGRLHDHGIVAGPEKDPTFAG